MGDKAAMAVYPEFNAELPELRTQFQIMNGDAEASTKPIRHDFKATDNFQDGIFLSYYKGKSVLGMFEEAVGAEVFRDGVIRYLRKYSRDNAEAANLWAEINAGAEFDLAGGMASFIDQPGVPLVTVSELGGGRYQFSQSRIVTGGTKIEQSWVIPLSYRYSTGDSVRTASLVIDEASEVVDLDAEVDWILPNANERGYVRWSVPQDMLAELGADAITHLNVRERMGFLSNLWALLGADKLDGDQYLAAMQNLAADTDADVLRALIDQLPDVRETFIVPELQPQFAVFVDDLLSPVVQRIGTTPLPDDSNAMASLRPRILAYLAIYAENDAAREIVEDTVTAYLAGDTPMSESVERALRTLPRWSGEDLFETYKKRIAVEKSPGVRRTLVSSLAGFREPEVVNQVLDYVLNGDELRAGEVSQVLAVLFQAEAINTMLVDWAMQNDATLREMLTESEMVRMPGRLMLCSAENVAAISEFYLAPERFVGGIENEVAEEAAEKRSCAAFRAREIDSVREYLSAS
jgi:alanyl aminopeptidase